MLFQSKTIVSFCIIWHLFAKCLLITNQNTTLWCFLTQLSILLTTDIEFIRKIMIVDFTIDKNSYCTTLTISKTCTRLAESVNFLTFSCCYQKNDF